MKHLLKRRLPALAMAMALLLTACAPQTPPEETPVLETRHSLTAQPLTTQHDAEWYWDSYLVDLVYPMQGNYPTTPLDDQRRILVYCAARYARDTGAVPDQKGEGIQLPMSALQEYATRYFGVDVRQYDWGDYAAEDAVFSVYCQSLMNDLTGRYEDWAFRLLSAEERADEPGVVDVRIGSFAAGDMADLYPEGYDSWRTVTLVHTGDDQFAIREIALEHAPDPADYSVEGALSRADRLAGDYTYRFTDPQVLGDSLLLLEQMEPDNNNYESRLSELLYADPATGEVTGRWSIPEALDSHSATRPNGDPILLGSQIYLPERQETIPCHLLEGGQIGQMGFDNAVTRAVVRDENASIWLYDVASGESDMLLPASDEYGYYHPSFIGESDYFYCQRFSSSRYVPDAIILQDLATGEQTELPLEMGEAPSTTVLADAHAIYCIVQKSQPLTNGVFEITAYPLANPQQPYSYTLKTALDTSFYDLGGGRALIQTTVLQGANRTYQQLLLDLATGEVTDTGFVLRTVTENPAHRNALRVWFLGCTEQGVGIFQVTSLLGYDSSALYTAQLFEPTAK